MSSPPPSTTPPKQEEAPAAADERHPTDINPEDARFTPEEETELLNLALSHKARGNKLFASTPPDYDGAVSAYTEALSCCPKYLHADRAVFHANIAACYIKLELWKEAEEAATQSLIESGDEKVAPPPERSSNIKHKDEVRRKRPKKVKKGQTLDNGVEVESSDDDDEFEDAVEEINPKKEEKEEVVEEVVREEMKQAGNWKARLRRAKAREMQGKWGSLAGSLEDYTVLYKYPPKPPAQPIPPTDMKTIRMALVRLPPLIERKKKEEVDEMLGKLKELGNGLLRPFGLSTANFGMTQNEGGGYSLSFNQNPPK